jgi:cell division septation protein DedD
MSMMLTFRAGKLAALIVSLTVLGACSREQQDWRSAEAADSVAGYGQFLQRHPDSELATEARTRVAQLSEDLEWQRAGSADNADAYKQFLAQHPNGKWAQEARIRMENFALGREGSAAGSPVSGEASVSSGASVSDGASVSVPAAGAASASAAAASDGGARALPGEAARAFPGEAARAQTASGELARGPTSAQVSPGEAATSVARAVTPASAQPLPGEPTTAPTSMQAFPSTSPQPSPAIATAWKSDDGFGVQLGAFASEDAATNEWQQLTARFSAELRGLSPRVVSANTSTGRLFRLQALVADEARARALCDMLKKQSQACVPVLPH